MVESAFNHDVMTTWIAILLYDAFSPSWESRSEVMRARAPESGLR